MRLKVLRLAYSKGLISGRTIEAACREHVRLMAISGDSQPHVTTIAPCVSRLGEPMAPRLAQVLVVCDRQGLIGRQMFAIMDVEEGRSHSTGSRALGRHEGRTSETGRGYGR